MTDQPAEPFDAVMEDLRRIMRRCDMLGLTMVAALGEYKPHRGDGIDQDRWSYTFSGSSFAGLGLASILHARMQEGSRDGDDE